MIEASSPAGAGTMSESADAVLPLHFHTDTHIMRAEEIEENKAR